MIVSNPRFKLFLIQVDGSVDLTGRTKLNPDQVFRLLYGVFRLIICSIPAWLKISVFRLLNFSGTNLLCCLDCFTLLSTMATDDRVLCDPCLTVGDLEKVFTLYFADTSRNLQPVLDFCLNGAETWKTAPKALMGFPFLKTNKYKWIPKAQS